MALVLNLGNALNANRGVARGFTLSSLPKLLDTRSFDGTTTLLHYLVAHLESRDEELLSFAAELPHLERAARLTFAMVEEELAPLGGGLAALETELEAAEARARCWTRVTPRNARRRRDDAWNCARGMARGSPGRPRVVRRRGGGTSRGGGGGATRRGGGGRTRGREERTRLSRVPARVSRHRVANVGGVRGEPRSRQGIVPKPRDVFRRRRRQDQNAPRTRTAREGGARFLGAHHRREGKIAERWTPRRRARRRGGRRRSESRRRRRRGTVARRAKDGRREKDGRLIKAVVARQAQTGGEEHVPRG